MKKTVYVVASTWMGSELSIESFFNKEKCLKYMNETINDWHEKPDPEDDPIEYMQRYYDWVREERDNMCDVDIIVKVIELN